MYYILSTVQAEAEETNPDPNISSVFVYVCMYVCTCSKYLDNYEIAVMIICKLVPQIPIPWIRIVLENYLILPEVVRKCPAFCGSIPPLSLSLWLTFWLRDASTSLTFSNCMLCPYCIYVLCKQRLVPVRA
jgi:hypothetical protein